MPLTFCVSKSNNTNVNDDDDEFDDDGHVVNDCLQCDISLHAFSQYSLNV